MKKKNKESIASRYVDAYDFSTTEKVIYISCISVISAGILAFSFLPIFASLKEDNRKANCDIEGKHAHYYYYPSNGLGTYLCSEKIHVHSFDSQYYGEIERTDKYISLNDEELKLIEFLGDNELISISENREKIEKLLKIYNDHTEYECSSNDAYFLYNYNYPDAGLSPYYILDDESYSWTTDPNLKSCSGRSRECNCTYYAYKVYKDENGNYILNKSKGFNDFSDLPEGYEYIKPEFFSLVYTEVEQSDENEIDEFSRTRK